MDIRHYFTMACIEGGTLADRIASDGPMPCRRVAVLIAKLVPTAPSAVRADIDPVLEAICLKAMSRVPEDRFASADDLAIALRDYLRGATTPPRPAAAFSAYTDEDRCAADATRVRELWRGEQFAAALAILKQLARLTDSVGKKYADWARQEIPKVRAQIEQANQTIV